tara:strand:- start:205 stop:432 length:228 start_codon:yes stop_codon:yes gene_type:complete
MKSAEVSAYRFNVVLVGVGEGPQEAFSFVLDRLHSSPLEALDGEVVYAEIEDPEDLAEQMGKLLCLNAQPTRESL